MHLEVAGARKSENPSLEGSSSGHMTDNDMRLVCNSSMESTVHVIRDYISGMGWICAQSVPMGFLLAGFARMAP